MLLAYHKSNEHMILVYAKKQEKKKIPPNSISILCPISKSKAPFLPKNCFSLFSIFFTLTSQHQLAVSVFFVVFYLVWNGFFCFLFFLFFGRILFACCLFGFFLCVSSTRVRVTTILMTFLTKLFQHFSRVKARIVPSW